MKFLFLYIKYKNKCKKRDIFVNLLFYKYMGRLGLEPRMSEDGGFTVR